jgi:hypothetical protein
MLSVTISGKLDDEGIRPAAQWRLDFFSNHSSLEKSLPSFMLIANL